MDESNGVTSKKARHINIPVFIPHLGCPNNCVFCNQRSISGHGDFDISSVRGEIEAAVRTIDYSSCEVEIAFFGGSFTGIDRSDMTYLLSLASEYIESGKASAVRISTRPDYINDEILDILGKYHVTDIELGLQSMDDEVLALSKRGHTAEIARNACRMIKKRGFRLVGQMMIGLPGSDIGKEISTAGEIASLCDGARIYPTVVFSDTELCEMMKSGEYIPLSLDDAVIRSEAALNVFINAGIQVLRLGLCASDNLSDPEKAVAGAGHSALGELVYGEHYMRIMREYISKNQLCLSGKRVIIHAPSSEVSKVSGQRKKNKQRLISEYGAADVKIIADDSLSEYEIRIEAF